MSVSADCEDDANLMILSRVVPLALTLRPWDEVQAAGRVTQPSAESVLPQGIGEVYCPGRWHRLWHPR